MNFVAGDLWFNFSGQVITNATFSVTTQFYLSLMMVSLFVALMAAVAVAYRAAFVLPTLDRGARRQLRAALVLKVTV